jgi:nicotinate phosphoribosyltransferase
MDMLSTLYPAALGLFTDLYQVTMAYSYWKTGVQDRESVFQLFFRRNPFRGGFAISAGLATAIEYLAHFRFGDDDVAYLASLKGNDDRPLFEPAFLDYLARMPFRCDVDAIPEGTVVFPHEPLIRVQGPILQAQLLESALLCIVNFQTLIATKAARVVMATAGEPVLEFGMRRAQGIDGALSASRAAHIGGCAATSNLLAGRLFGIPVKGTHAHSWVMCFDDELDAFRQYAKAMPNNCVFLVDTYDTLQGVRNAITVARELREEGHEIVGVRLDSGDLAWLSIEARRLLDEAGFPHAQIVASNDLDENIITSLKQQGAKIAVWGVGTKLATAFDEPALGGVYKLAAVRSGNGPWKYKVKLSEQAIKTSNPGILQVRRFYSAKEAIGDMIFDQEHPPEGPPVVIDPLDPTRRKKMLDGATCEDLLVPVYRQGTWVYEAPTLAAIRARAQQQLATFHGGVKRFVNPHRYPVGLESGLHERKTQLILHARGVAP